ncbi:MAG: hypothetical protein IJ207_03000 [Treponema sp.]|uniref:hypothetical protein n=1 Tax=Treponema sp. TaxID=166 RepID=UPI0025EF7164|nr:hypothetical protein [Treponema sp.]MBQ9281147.1 hypothetical protein [Treponema sp.]
MNEQNEIEIDESKLNVLMSKIVFLENQNLKTHNSNDIQMIEKIQKSIEEAVKCYSNQ